MKGSYLSLTIVTFACLFTLNVSQIHRAANKNDYKIKYDSNFTMNYILKQLYLANSGADATGTTSGTTNGLDSGENRDLIVLITTIIGTFFVGVCGIIPVIFLPQLAQDHQKLIKSVLFKCLVSFAAGSLIGDVFIHLLPEAYSKHTEAKTMSNGIWLIFGLMAFLSIEKLFPDSEDEDDAENEEEEEKDKRPAKSRVKRSENISDSIKTIGVLNLIANVIDNFTHGIAVAGSFQASLKFGVMTLLATLLHEIPHEIGDFVILLKSGLNYKQAALAQLVTAFAGIIGAIFALSWSSAERAGDATSWILPFTSGGFLYISMVNILPEIAREKNIHLCLKQILAILVGMFAIYVFNFLF